MPDMTAPAIPTAIVPLDRTPTAVRVDNLIRQKLRIGDPRDPVAVAEGLRRLFPGDARLQDLETLGLPSLPTRFGTAVARPSESLATSAELDQANADVERDLRALTTDHRLKDIEIELQGWGQAIRGIVADGVAAARLALDPRARDRMFAARRQLGDYARLARFVGALTPALSPSYRKLAQSLDEVGALTMVLAGEALASSGIGGGRFLLSVPASELQTRRDAVLLALRALQGTTEQAVGNDQWPWSLHGLREMLLQLENSGHLDLRSLLEEPVLGRLMDEMIERAGQQSTSGLRALGATAEITLQRLYRLLHVVDNRVSPPAPALMTFMKAIQLFLDAFRSSRSGYRLLYVGRAPIAFYGLVGSGGPDQATQRLIDLVIRRGRLAEILDCYLGCECCGDEVICQILLDKLLYDVDRAIDLYTLGIDPLGAGEPEWRAAAYGVLIRQFLLTQQACLPQPPCAPVVADLPVQLAGLRDTLLAGKVVPALPTAPQTGWMADELCLQQLSDARLATILATLAPGCVPATDALLRIETLINATIGFINPLHGACAEPVIEPPPTTESSLQVFYRANRAIDGILGRRP